MLPANPLKGMKRPKPPPRSRAMTDAGFRSLLRAEKNPRFRAFLYALRSTGCRPKEARTLTWSQVRDDRWVLNEHKTSRKTGKPRVVYLTGPMRKLMRILRRQELRSGGGRAIARYRDPDHVFLNAYGRPWTRDAVRQRVERLREKAGLPDDVCAYLLRHAFGTHAIVNGVDVATVAELMGHTSLEMVTGVYLHLADQQKHLQDAAERATARPAPSKPSPAVAS